MTKEQKERERISNMLAEAVQNACGRCNGVCPWLQAVCKFLRRLEDAPLPLEALEVCDAWETDPGAPQEAFSLCFYAETEEEAQKAKGHLRQTLEALQNENALEVAKEETRGGLEVHFYLKAKTEQNTMKREKIAITISLEAQTLQALGKQAKRFLRSRANYASFLIKEGVARQARQQTPAEIQAELEARANAPEGAEETDLPAQVAPQAQEGI